MANEITVSIADASLQEIWIAEALEGLYEGRKVSKEPVIWVKTFSGKNRGDNVDFTEYGTTTTNAVGADGTVTNQAVSQTQRQVALNSWREATWDVVDRAAAQSVLDMSVDAPREQAAAIGQYMDDTVLDDHGSFTGSLALGDTQAPAAMSLDLAVESDVVLSDIPIPETEPKHFIFSPRSFGHLFKNELLASAAASGDAKGLAKTGEIKTLLGYPVIKTSRVVTTGTPQVEKNFLMGRRAIAMGICTDLKLDIFRTKKSHQYSTDVLFGEAVIRSNFAAVINAKSAA